MGPSVGAETVSETALAWILTPPEAPRTTIEAAVPGGVVTAVPTVRVVFRGPLLGRNVSVAGEKNTVPMGIGNPEICVGSKVTSPVKPAPGVTVMVYKATPPAVTELDAGAAETVKFAPPLTVTGNVPEFPLCAESVAVNAAVTVCTPAGNVGVAVTTQLVSPIGFEISPSVHVLNVSVCVSGLLTEDSVMVPTGVDRVPVSVSMTVTSNGADAIPTVAVRLVGLKDTLTFRSATVRVVCAPVVLTKVAVMVTFPVNTPVACPAGPRGGVTMVAMFVLVDAQVTSCVTSAWLPSLAVAVAVN
jgi:hypothetical protein